MTGAREGRRWRSTEPGRAGLELEPFSPSAPGAGDLLVSVDYAALNFSDLLMLDDMYQVRPDRPFTPGQEVAGQVLSVGEGCTCEPGDRIAAKVVTGGFATHAVVPERHAIRVPTACDLASAAALPVSYTTAYVALTESTHLAGGETILVHAAAGAIGLAAVQIASEIGACVIATAGSAEKRALAGKNGAAECLDYREEGWVAACRAAAGERGVDVIFDTVGGDVTTQSLKVLGSGGRLLVVGFASGSVPHIPAHRLLLKRLSAIGVYWSHDTDTEMLARVNRRLSEDLENGRICPQTEHRAGLAALPAALSDLAERRTTGKVVLETKAEK